MYANERYLFSLRQSIAGGDPNRVLLSDRTKASVIRRRPRTVKPSRCPHDRIRRYDPSKRRDVGNSSVRFRKYIRRDYVGAIGEAVQRRRARFCTRPHAHTRDTLEFPSSPSANTTTTTRGTKRAHDIPYPKTVSGFLRTLRAATFPCGSRVRAFYGHGRPALIGLPRNDLHVRACVRVNAHWTSPDRHTE